MDGNQPESVVSDLRRIFNDPPQPPLDEMWAVIEDAHFNVPRSIPTTRGMLPSAPWMVAAAALLVGIGIGHYFPGEDSSQIPNSPEAAATDSPLPAYKPSACADALSVHT